MKKFRVFMTLLCLAAGAGLISCKPGNQQQNPPGETTKYIVTFNTNGGSVVTAAEVVNGEKATKPADPTKDGYTFGGWFKDAECTQEWKFDSDVVTSSINLYAKWVKIEVTEYKAVLKYNNGEADGVIVAVEDGGNYYIDAPATTPKKEYMEFDFWASDEAGTTKFNFAEPITGDVTLYAVYKQAFDKVSTTFNVDEAANIAGDSLTEDTLFFGRFTLGKGMKLEADNDAINTQGKTITFDLTAADNRNSVVFNAAGASSSGDTEISLINLTTGETVETWSAANKVQVDKTISNLPAGSYQITTSRSARVYAFAITEELPQAPTSGISVSSLGVVKDFLLGSSFTAVGLDVKLIYENGREDAIAIDDANLSLSAVDMAVAGKKTVTVSYQVNKDTTYTSSYEITVYEPTDIVVYDYVLNSSRVTVHRQEIFAKGSEFSFDNNVVKAKCLIPDTDNEYIEFLLDANQFEVSTPDLTTTGFKNITVSYTANPSLTAEYMIHVVDVTIDETAKGISFYANVYNQVTYEGNSLTDINVCSINQATQYAELLNIADSVEKFINVCSNEVHFEKVEITLPNTTLTSYGEGPATIEFNALNGLVDPSESISYSTDGSATVSVRESAEGFKAYDIIINNYYNTHERYEESKLIAGSGTQAVALLLQADKVMLEKVTLSSYQDTLYAQVGRHYFKDCTIIGRTDYIFGYDATSYFDNCTLQTIGAGVTQNNGGYVVATKGNPSGTPGSDSYKNINYGYIFNNCTFTADDNTMSGSVTLARGWDVGMTMMVMNSSISHHFSKEAYGYVTPDDPNTEETEKNLNDRYSKMNADPYAPQLLEYNNTGEGAIAESIENTCTVVDAETAAKYADFKLVFGKNNGTTTYTTSWAGPAAKDVTVNLIVDGEVAGVVYEYSGNSLPKDNCVAPVLSGKKFVGWYADEELTVEYDFSTELTVNQELNLYAKYEGVNYDVHTLIVPEKGQSWTADTQIDEAGVLFLTNKVKTESIQIEGASYPTDNLVFENTQISLTSGKVQIDGGNFLNAIKVVVERNAVITVYAAQKSGKTTNLKVLNLDGTDATIENLRIDGVPATEFNTLPTTSVSKYEFNVGPGIYGIGGAGGGAYVYGLNVAIEVEQEITNPVPSFSIIADDAEGVMVAQTGQVTTLGTPAIVTFTTTHDTKCWNYDLNGKTIVVDGV